MRLCGPLHPLFLRKNWAQIEPLLLKLIEHEKDQGFTLSGLADGINNHRWQVWLFEDWSAIFLTTIYQQQNGELMCSINMAAGEKVIENVDVVLSAIEPYARLHGCYGIEVVGRRGWERVVKPRGYEHYYIAQIKVLK